MKEINENDYRALELARELFALKAKLEEAGRESFNAQFGDRPAVEKNKMMMPYKTSRDRIERIEWALEEWAKGEDILAAMLADPRDDKNTRDTLAFHHSAWAKAAMRNAITMQHTTSGNAIHTNVTLSNVPLSNALDNSLAAFGNALDHFNKQKGA